MKTALPNGKWVKTTYICKVQSLKKQGYLLTIGHKSYCIRPTLLQELQFFVHNKEVRNRQQKIVQLNCE